VAHSFPERTVEAVGACTRALSGWPDADNLLSRSTAASLGGFRAYADRLALRRRHHDRATHRQYLPANPAAAEEYTALEAARLDALGARWLEGIARNLTAHPGTEHDGLRWLAFELFSARPAPPEKLALVARVRASLPPRVVVALGQLATALEPQSSFAAAASAWALTAAAYLPPASISPAPSDPFPLPVRRVERHERRKEPASTSGTERRERQDDDASSSGGAADATGGSGASSSESDEYHVFTTAHDRVVSAAALANRHELAAFRAKLETELSTVPSVVSRLAKKLLRVLMARQTRQWQFDQEEGLLDGSRLSALVASPGGVRPFKQETESRFPSTVVSLLIDHSGSMRGRPMLIAAVTVEIFARVLERCGVRCEILGFTTRDWNGGEPAREWAAGGYEENPGRLNALEHIVIKSADVPWRRARVALGLFLHDDMLKENIDGEAVAWAHTRLLARGEQRRILVVVSDGTPMDEATLTANGHEYLDRHLLSVVHGIETRSPVQLAAIGIGHDVSRFYRNATTVARIDDLGPALTAKLMTLLAEDPG
jgi:cobaltochelatase CobT